MGGVGRGSGSTFFTCYFPHEKPAEPQQGARPLQCTRGGSAPTKRCRHRPPSTSSLPPALPCERRHGGAAGGGSEGGHRHGGAAGLQPQPQRNAGEGVAVCAPGGGGESGPVLAAAVWCRPLPSTPECAGTPSCTRRSERCLRSAALTLRLPCLPACLPSPAASGSGQAAEVTKGAAGGAEARTRGGRWALLCAAGQPGRSGGGGHAGVCVADPHRGA